jgi:hypothetical protein
MEGQQVRMACMDFKPAAPSNGRSIMLLHGKNFDSSYWAGPIDWDMLAAPVPSAGFILIKRAHGKLHDADEAGAVKLS